MKFTVILSGNRTISAPQGEEALKWRFLFDCPCTRKEICEETIMVGTSLEYKKGASPFISQNKSTDRKFKKCVEELLQKHAEVVQICNTGIPHKAVNIVLEAHQLVELLQTKMVIAYKSETNLYICCKRELMEEAIRHVNNVKDYALRLISKTETILLKDIPPQLMKRWLEVHMSPDTSDIHYEFREDQKCLHITGIERVIIQEKDKLINLLGNVTHTRYKSRLCAAHFSVFEQSEVVKYIERILQEHKLVCTWETNKADCCIAVTAFDKETCEMACKEIDAACVTEDVSLQMDAVTKILPSDSWEQELSSLYTKFEGRMMIWLDQEKNILEYVYTQDIKDIVKHEVQDIVDNWNREKLLLIEKLVAEKLEKEKQKLRELEKCYSVTISIRRKIEKMGVLIVGKDINIQPAEEELKKECTLIMKQNSNPAVSLFSRENCEFFCVSESDDVEVIMLKDKHCFHMNNQAELIDTETETEIVEITPKFSLKVSQPDEVEAHMVLPADKSKRPVTFCCPNWNEDKLEEKFILDTVLCLLFEFLSSLGGEALLELEDKKIGNWHVTQFVELMLVTYQNYLKANQATKMSRLFLLMKDEEVYSIVRTSVLAVYFPNKLHSDDNRVSSPKEEASVMSKDSQMFCGIKALDVFVVKGQLTDRKVDVLVNTADPELKLESGAVSKSIYEAAGRNIQVECKKLYPNGIKPGEVAETKAHKLKSSRYIFHGTFDMWDPKMEEKLKYTLKEFVTLCLQKADKANMESIAFPAIGTGILNYPSVVVADCMFEAVEQYIRKPRPGFLQEVFFVIYGKDKTNIADFDTRKKLHDQNIEGLHVGQESLFPSGGSESMRNPTNQENNSLKETSQPGSSKGGRSFVTDEIQYLTNSKVRISPEVMAKFTQGELEHIVQQFSVKIDFNTDYIKGQLADLKRLESHLQDLMSSYLDNKSFEEYHNLHKMLVVDNVSEMKYKAFKYFFLDLYVSAVQKEIQFSFDPNNKQMYVQGRNEEAVNHAVDKIRRAEIAHFQESEADITSEQFENAQTFIVKMKSSSADKNVFCCIDEKNPWTVHFVAKTYKEIETAKHKMKLHLGTIKIKNPQNKSASKFDDKSDTVKLSLSLKRSSHDASRKSFTTAEGIKVFVHKCSILQAEVGIIVNAANEDLKHIGGVAKVIADEAGNEFIEESHRYIMENGNLEVGTACITSGGNLKYPFVIHSVGPQWEKYNKVPDGVKQCMDDLWKAVFCCFMKAAELQMQSVALPAISSGSLLIPMEICASQYLKAVMAYSKTTECTGSLKEIHFVDVKDEIINLIELVFSAALENNQASSKEFNDRLQKVLSSCQDPSTQQIFASVASFQDSVPSSNEQKCMVQFTKIFKVLIYAGDITDSQCKAVVSSNDKQLKSNGGLATAMLGKTGKDFERHTVNNKEKDSEVGDVIEIDAGYSKHQNVIYCIIPKLTSTVLDEDYKRQLGQYFRDILEKAKAYESVAIPLTGIGFEDNSITVCGRILLECMLQFSEAHTEEEAIREVHIVNLDDGSIACVKRIFMEHFNSEKLDAVNANLGVVSATASDGHDQDSLNSNDHRNEMQQVTKSGQHSETREEANMDIGKNLGSYNTGSNQYPGAQTMNRSDDDKQDQCVICLDTFEMPVMMKKCGHMFCKGCIDTHLQNKPVCPVCGTIYGVITGNQPEGRMTECVHKDLHLDGYRECGMITITYDIPNGIQGKDHPKPGQCYSGLNRKAYLPNNEKGQKVLHLLHLAFDRRLIFTIGRSVTTGHDDMVTWNDIHHKTNVRGGPQSYGYPDPTYLDRVLEELAAKGVTEESEHQVPGNFSDYYKLTPVEESTV